MQAFHRNSRHALPRQFSLDIGQATSTFHRESTRTEDSVALMERAVRTSGNQGPKGQRAKGPKGQRAKGPNCRHESLESLESLVPDSSFASSLYSNLYRFFLPTPFLG